MPICATDVVKVAWKVVKEIDERIQGLLENDDLRKRLEKRLKDLKQVANDLKSSDIEDLPESCAEYIQKLEDSLGTCERICGDLRSAASLGRFVRVHAHRSQLETLDNELEKAQKNLHFALTRAMFEQNRELKRCVREGNARVEATVIHPSVGVYMGAAKALTRPLPISKPNVVVKEDLMVIKWSDQQNSPADIERYEVRYDDELEKIVHDAPQKLQSEDDTEQYTFALSLGYPKVLPGKLYPIQVRAVNKQGPGDWSERRVTRFKTGPPNKPSKPKVTIQSPTEVLVEVQRLRVDDENGSPVHQCAVEYISVTDTNASDWDRITCNISAKPAPVIKLSIKQLTPDTTYSFRVKMINEAGESTPSEAREIVTTQLIPGPPQELRASSMRLDKLIKIRWQEPEENPQAVSKYEVQIQRVGRVVKWDPVTTTEKLSAKATNLGTDTKYAFRVRAINDKGQEGKFSDLLQAETRYGKAARIAAATGAFLGGTLGGPLLGAFGLGHMAGSSASDAADSKAGKAAASTTAGIGGGIGGAIVGTLAAPVFGGVSAAVVYRTMKRGMDDWSPQSSEDEEEESLFGAVMKASRKKSESMMNK